MRKKLIVLITTLILLLSIFTIPSYAAKWVVVSPSVYFPYNDSHPHDKLISDIKDRFSTITGYSYVDVDLQDETLYLEEEFDLCASKETKLIIHDGVIDCQNKCRLFDISCAGINIEMYNITVQNCAANNGAAIYIGNNNVTISNPKNDDSFIIKDCKASNCGGAIKMDAYSDGSKISNIVFESCEAGDDGGAIITNGNGNTIENCKYNKCSCKDAGGAIYVWDPCSVNGSTFKFNTSPYGNDIYLADYLKLNKCTFIGNDRDQALYLYGDDYLTEDTENKFYIIASTIMSEGRVWIIGGIVLISACIIAILLRKKKFNSN